MRDNHPVTQRAFEFPDDATLMSTTDTQSHITYANDAFVSVSGYTREEIQGQPHNLVRHPDMPKEAFADMWATLKAGQPWTALVKNRRKNGDHYWVRANATPVVRHGQQIGYMSVRTKASHEEIAAAESLYRDFREGKAGNRRFHKGLIVRTGLGAWTSLRQTMPVRWRIRSTLLLLAAALLGVAWASGLNGGMAMLGFSGAVAALALLANWALESQIALDQITQQNAALVEQGAAASESVKQQMASLADAVAVFR